MIAGKSCTLLDVSVPVMTECSKIAHMSDLISKTTKRIGVVGVGLLGSAMAQRLVLGGWKMLGFDLKSYHVDGVGVMASLGELVRQADVILFCLPKSSVTLQLILENQESFSPGQIVLDATTGSPEQMERVSAHLSEIGVPYMEANVAGSSDLMRRGEAAMFFAGDAKVFDSLNPLIQHLTSKPFYLGGVGAASRFKLVHNMILGLHRMVLAEGLAFADALGIDSLKALEVLKQTPAASGVMESKGERMVHGQFEPPQARLSQHLKDVKIMLEEAEKKGLKVPLTSLHAELLQQAEQLGLGKMDNSAVAALYRNQKEDGADHG